MPMESDSKHVGMCSGSFQFRLLRGPLLVLLFVHSGCTANRAPIGSPLDLSSPKPAALSFLHAIANGDARAAKAASVGTDHDRQWVDAIVMLITGMRAYDNALMARFGDAAISTNIELEQAIDALANEPIRRLEGGIVKESDENAEVAPALNGVRLAARPPIYLLKEKGVWKVDLAAMKDDPTRDPAVIDQFSKAGKALHQAALAIRRGHYKTLEAALTAGDTTP